MTRPIVVTQFITLDGVVDSPGGGSHPHAGWTFKDVAHEDAAYEIKGRETQTATALLLGRRTYDEFAPVWPSMEEFAEYNAMPKHVVSATLSDPTWNNTHVLRSLDEVAALKETDGGEIHVHGSPTLARGLLAAGLVDRLHLLTFPVVLGGGLRLFGEDGPKVRLGLTEHAAYANGVTLSVYDVLA